VRSLRPVEHLSQMPWAAEHLGGKRVCRSTLSDALARFDPEQLKPVIDGLMKQIPHLARRDGDLEQVCRKIIAADGSTFALAADVAWAMIHQRGGKDPRSHGTCRLNLQLCVDSFTPVDLSVSGSDEGGEAAAFARRILPEVTYLFDRNFVHFGLINRVLEQGSDLVLRLRKDTGFAPVESRLLGAKDVAAKVQSDRVGTLPGSPGGRTGPPPRQQLRELIVDGDDGKPLRLITNLLDLPAHVIAALYRRRWQVELFFRWLKVWAGFEHLISRSKKGVTFQFYVAVIGCLLMHVRTGQQIRHLPLRPGRRGTDHAGTHPADAGKDRTRKGTGTPTAGEEKNAEATVRGRGKNARAVNRATIWSRTTRPLTLREHRPQNS
jgi:transposase